MVLNNERNKLDSPEFVELGLPIPRVGPIGDSSIALSIAGQLQGLETRGVAEIPTQISVPWSQQALKKDLACQFVKTC